MKISIIVRRYQSGQSSLFTSSIFAISCLDKFCAIFCSCYCFFHWIFLAFFGFAGFLLFVMGINIKIYGQKDKSWPSETWLIGGAMLLVAVLLVTLTIFFCCCCNDNQENWQQVSYIKYYQLQ